MKITALVENTSVREDIEAEHGLSLYIECCGVRLLFDMGQSELFYKNAKRLGIELEKTDIAILSHGHYDHGGGMKKFLEINKNANIYLQKDAFLPHYNGKDKYIGLDTELMGDRRPVFTDGVTRLSDAMTLYPASEIKTIVEAPRSGLYERVGEGFIEDDFRHEQYLLITEGDRRVLISGCSHKGIINILDRFRPDVLIGGFHLSKIMPGEELRLIGERIAEYRTELYTCHCTGSEQYGFLKEIIPSLKYLAGGEEIII